MTGKRLLAVLNRAAEAGDWGKVMPSRTAQGIAVHSEYQGAIAVLEKTGGGGADWYGMTYEVLHL